MSIPVEVERLGEVLAEHGTGYLLTTSPEGRVKAVTVEPTLLDGALRCPASRGSAGNLAANPAATLLFPPRVERGYTLLVDGTAVADDDGIAFTPVSAVLHRPAAHADGAATSVGDCGNDCAPVA
ncbi:pyridoxamine 5'-phosphate oxidase family protein [Nocardioides sp.]|uniref:pyridoxamine 5'-phosphate oxidase family protein n=1 Tax=Nocardioides sp. TaxID=35761 RepID=UPI002ED5B89B